jgi:hypothetical protein
MNTKTRELVLTLLRAHVGACKTRLDSCAFKVGYKKERLADAASKGAKTRAQGELSDLEKAHEQAKQDLADAKEALADMEAT